MEKNNPQEDEFDQKFTSHWEKSNEVIIVPNDMIDTTPNDQELGNKIRKLYWRIKGYSDPNDYPIH